MTPQETRLINQAKIHSRNAKAVAQQVALMLHEQYHEQELANKFQAMANNLITIRLEKSMPKTPSIGSKHEHTDGWKGKIHPKDKLTPQALAKLAHLLVKE